MESFEMQIIDELKKIDGHSVNLERDEINIIIDELEAIAVGNNSERWKVFLQSERAYYGGDFELSFELTKKAYELDKEEAKKNNTQGNYYITNSLAVSYFTIGDNAKAIKYFTRAIELNENYLQAYVDRAAVYRNIAQYESAKEDIEYVLEQEQSGYIYYQAQQSMGRINIALGRYDDAVNVLQSIYEDNKKGAEFLDSIALAYVYTQRYSDAQTMYKEAIKVCKDPELKKYLQIKLTYLESFEGDYEENPSGDLILGLSHEDRKIIERVYRNIKNETTILKKYEEGYLLEKRNRKIGKMKVGKMKIILFALKVGAPLPQSYHWEI